MAQPNSTVIVLAGRVAAGVFAELDRLTNVRASAIAQDPEMTAAAFVARSHTTYVVHDVDPLAPLGAAWLSFFEESAPAGTLEVALEATVRAFERGDGALPDYYIVAGLESLTATQRNWWFGALAGVAPARVIPSGATASAVQDTISGLPAGRWWPEPASGWIRSLARVVPDDRSLVRPT